MVALLAFSGGGYYNPVMRGLGDLSDHPGQVDMT